MRIYLNPRHYGSKYKHAKAVEERSKRIDRQMSSFRIERRHDTRILVLGPSGSGKSTILNSWRLTDYDLLREDREGYRLMILDHIVLSTQTIAKQLAERDNPFPEQTEAILARPLNQRDHEVSSKSVQVLRMIWDDDEFRKAFTIMQEEKLGIPVPNLKYFLEHHERILADDYLPTEDDIIQLAIPACSNYQVRTAARLKRDDMWTLFEPGQYAISQPKWWPYLDDIDVILFVVSLSEYDTESAFKESVDQFRSICNAPCFNKAVIFLVFNKNDLFKEKLAKDPLKNYFPEYSQGNGPSEEPWKAVGFIIDLFLDANPRKETMYVYCHVTNALDYRGQMPWIFACIHSLGVEFGTGEDNLIHSESH